MHVQPLLRRRWPCGPLDASRRIRKLCFVTLVLGVGGAAAIMIGCGGGSSTGEDAMHKGHSVPHPASQPEAGTYDSTGDQPVQLPSTVGGWQLKDEHRIITAKTIFDYMDGAGELYIGYRFKQLEVHEYTSKGTDNILVELYWMASSDDAFGLLSGDWGGEAVSLQRPVAAATPPEAATWPHALYGAGLLRLWSDNLYARVLSQTDTEASKKAVLEIGRAITAGRRATPAPRLAVMMPGHIGSNFALRRDRLCFFRSYLVLNSVYFLSSSNILDLGLGAEAAIASYEAGGPGTGKSQVRLLIVRYPDTGSGRGALGGFIRTYLPEKNAKVPAVPGGDRDTIRIEDGWTGYSLSGSFLALVFECPTREMADTFLNRAMKIAGDMEGSHER